MELPMSKLRWGDDYVAMIDGEPATGDVVARAEDGRLLSIVGYKDGYQHGQMRKYYPDGSLREEAFFRHGRSAGTFRIWYPNGQLKEEYISTDDARELLRHREWREDGTLKYDSNPGYDANIDGKPGTDA